MHDAIAAFERVLREHQGRTIALCYRKQIVRMTVCPVRPTRNEEEAIGSGAHVDEVIDDEMLDRFGNDGYTAFGSAIGDRRSSGQ